MCDSVVQVQLLCCWVFGLALVCCLGLVPALQLEWFQRWLLWVLGVFTGIGLLVFCLYPVLRC